MHVSMRNRRSSAGSSSTTLRTRYSRTIRRRGPRAARVRRRSAAGLSRVARWNSWRPAAHPSVRRVRAARSSGGRGVPYTSRKRLSTSHDRKRRSSTPSSSSSPATRQRDRFQRGGTRDAASTASAGGALSTIRSRSRSATASPPGPGGRRPRGRVGRSTTLRMARTASPASAQSPGQAGEGGSEGVLQGLEDGPALGVDVVGPVPDHGGVGGPPPAGPAGSSCRTRRGPRPGTGAPTRGGRRPLPGVLA